MSILPDEESQELVDELREEIAALRERCERYAIAGLPGVSFCNKNGARIVGELVAELRARATKAEAAIADSRAREAKLRELADEMQRQVLNDEPNIQAVALELMTAALSAPANSSAQTCEICHVRGSSQRLEVCNACALERGAAAMAEPPVPPAPEFAAGLKSLERQGLMKGQAAMLRSSERTRQAHEDLPLGSLVLSANDAEFVRGALLRMSGLPESQRSCLRCLEYEERLCPGHAALAMLDNSKASGS